MVKIKTSGEAPSGGNAPSLRRFDIRGSRARISKGFWAKIGIPSRGVELHQAVSEGFDFAVAKRLTETTGLPAATILISLKIPPASYERRRQEGRFKPQESDRLYRFAEAFHSAVELFDGDEEAARDWMEKPAIGLGGRRPMDMLKTSAEFESLMDLIGRLEHGVVV